MGGSYEDHLRGMLGSIDGSQEKDADNVTALLRRGLTLHKMGQYDGGDACLDRAVDLAGDDERDLAREVMCVGKGVAMNRLRRYGEAVSYYKKAIKINPTRGETYFFMDCAMDDKAESAKSVKYFDRAIRLGHTAPDVYYGKAHALNNCWRHRDAVPCLRKVLRAHPGYADAHYEMATSYMHLQDDRRGIGSYKRAIEANPHHKMAHEYLGIAYIKTGRDGVARKYLAKALEIAPGDPDVLEMLALLDN